ncbi:MAG: Ig-like domain-containing protein [Planctomycetota bacterium]
MCRFPLHLGLALLCAAPVATQSGPGLPSRVYPPGELFTIISSFGSGSYGHHFLHDGYLASLKTGGGVEFYDLSNPYAPVLVSSLTGSSNGMDLSEPHTYAQTSAWGGQHVVLARGPGGLGGTGFVISDWSDVFNPTLETRYDIPGVTGGYTTGVFWLFVQAPFIYVPVGSLGLAIIDASDPTSPRVVNQIPKSQLGGFNTVLAYAIGNTLVLTNSDGGPGFARFDISDPAVPVLIDSNPTTPIPYAGSINDGRFVVAAVSGPIAQPTGQNGSFHIHDLFAPGFPQIGEAPMPSRGGTALTQDAFVHVASSTVYRKLDVSGSPYTVVGSTSQPISGGDWDWVSPMGNVAILGDDQGQGSHIIPHQSQPDGVGPRVTMVDPPDGATDLDVKTRVGITASDMIEMGSIDTTTFIVRPVGGSALAGSYSNQFGIVNFWPRDPLRPDTTYEVVIAAGGMTDWAGNGLAETFVSQFTTWDAAGRVLVGVAAQAPIETGTPLNVTVESVTGVGPFQYSWDFGDGSPPTPFSTNPGATHTYTRGGHFSVLCRVTNGTAEGTASYLQTVHHPLTTDQPTHSSTIAIHEQRHRVFCVNADNDTVTSIHKNNYRKLFELPVDDQPRTVAFAPDETAWVVCQGDATINVVHLLSAQLLGRIQLPDASAPYGIAMSPDGRTAYVTLTATGQVAKLNTDTRRWIDTATVGPEPRGIAVSADGQRIFVTRHISAGGPAAGSVGPGPDGAPPRDAKARTPAGEVYELSAMPFARVRTIRLAFDPGPDTEASGRGVPNYLGSPAISTDGRRMWIPSKKDNIARGTFRSAEPLNFESTVRTIVSQIDLQRSREDLSARIDFNDRDMACAVAFSRLGDYTFHALQGSNEIDVRDAYTGDVTGDIPNTGLAPQGLVLSEDGRMFVHNFMSRNVTVYDVTGVTRSTTFAMPLITTVSTVANEALSPQELQGKQIFYNADDPRMNEDGYISCASCHLDGGQDGQVWDFTDRGEGLRNTISLQGRGGMGHGNVHWTANFDEIQDFENDIRGPFGGDGFMSDTLFGTGTVSNPLGQPKAGLSPELDALAAYVSSLSEFGQSPHRAPSGALTVAGARGKVVFEQLSCAQCHSGNNFTDGLLHNVGTIQRGSGQRIGGPLTGLETPTLRGLWNSAPYLHNGSAATLLDVITRRNPTGQHGATRALTKQERADLVQYLLQIDDREPAPQ